jgi:hypothetical protein
MPALPEAEGRRSDNQIRRHLAGQEVPTGHLMH